VRPLTKDEFLGDMLRGYSVIGYRLRGTFWGHAVKNTPDAKRGPIEPTDDPTKVDCACILGAAAFGAGMKPQEYVKRIPKVSARYLSALNDTAEKPYSVNSWQRIISNQFEQDMSLCKSYFAKIEKDDPEVIAENIQTARFGWSNRNIEMGVS